MVVCVCGWVGRSIEFHVGVAHISKSIHPSPSLTHLHTPTRPVSRTTDDDGRGLDEGWKNPQQLVEADAARNRWPLRLPPLRLLARRAMVEAEAAADASIMRQM